MPCRLCALIFGPATVGGLSGFSLITNRDRVTVCSPPAPASLPGAAMVSSTSRKTKVPANMLGLIWTLDLVSGIGTRRKGVHATGQNDASRCVTCQQSGQPASRETAGPTFSRLEGSWMRQLHDGTPRRVVQHRHVLSNADRSQHGRNICLVS